MKGDQIRVLDITVDKEDEENIEYVPVQARAVTGRGTVTPSSAATLPRFQSTYRSERTAYSECFRR